MKIEIHFDDDEWAKALGIFNQVLLKKGMSDSQPIKDKATFELKGPDGKVKQKEEGKSNAAG
jgi:hypothetical protein